MSINAPSAPTPAPKHIQGNLFGFNKDHQRLIFLAFSDPSSGKAFLAALAPRIANGREVLWFNRLFKEIRQRGGQEGTVESTWINVALSAAGLRQIAAPGIEQFPPEFLGGMAADAENIGDLGRSAPTNWIAPFNTPNSVHAVLIVAADSAEDRDAGAGRLLELCQTHSVTVLGTPQDGDVRPGEQRGREHFGFKDGISQPGVRGITTSSKDGQDEVAVGEFLIGYSDQDGAISGQGAVPAPPQPGDATYGQPTPAPPVPLPAWAKDGSFVVYRRLQQDVGAFQQFTQETNALGDTPEQRAAKLVGRWPSGAPMEPAGPTAEPSSEPSRSDPSATDQTTLDDVHINNFDFDPGDADGHAVPRAAHIRKTNPRSSLPGGRAEANRHRILRRGIPYGPEFQPGEPVYGTQPVTDARDRGLLFVCYQSSIERGFAFIQRSWANSPDFPDAGDGHDPIITQSVEPRDMGTGGLANPHVQMSQWVFTTAGEYFFSPSLPALKVLSA